MLLTDVAAAVYDSTNTWTLITCASGALTANLASIEHGWTFVDPTNHESNLAQHGHTDTWDGGGTAFSMFTDRNKVESLLTFVTVDSTMQNSIFGVNAAGTEVEKKTLAGTYNEVIVTPSPNLITFSLPQAIGTASTPTFGGLTLGSFGGALVANGGVVSAVAASAGGQVLMRSSDNTSYVFGNPPDTLAALTDVAIVSATNGGVLTWSGASSKWVASGPPTLAGLADVNETAIPSDGQSLILSVQRENGLRDRAGARQVRGSAVTRCLRSWSLFRRNDTCQSGTMNR